MPAITWVQSLEGPGFPTAAGTSFASFTTFQDVSPTPLPVVLAKSLRAGQVLELEAEGEFGTTLTPTLSIGFYWGTAALVLGQSAAITTASGAAAFPWHIKYRGRIVATGASGSIVGQGILDFGTSLTALTNNPVPITQALRTVTIDTTVDKTVGVGAAYSASNAANTIKVNNFTALLLN